MRDQLDRQLREMTFKDNWRTVAIREGFIKGVVSSSIVAVGLGTLLLAVFWGQIPLLYPHSACVVTYA